MSEPLKFKRGRSFDYAGPVQITDANNNALTDLTGWEAQSQIRRSNGQLVETLNVSWLSYSPPVLRLSCVNTLNWPIGSLAIDIVFKSPANDYVVSDTESIMVVDRVTQWS